MECPKTQIFTTNWPEEKESTPTRYSTGLIVILHLEQIMDMKPILELFLRLQIQFMATFGVKEAGSCTLSNQEKFQAQGEGEVEGEEE